MRNIISTAIAGVIGGPSRSRPPRGWAPGSGSASWSLAAGIVLLIAFTMRERQRYMERLPAIVATKGRRRAAGDDRAEPGS
jgi:hypothetical protein